MLTRKYSTGVRRGVQAVGLVLRTRFHDVVKEMRRAQGQCICQMNDILVSVNAITVMKFECSQPNGVPNTGRVDS